MNRAKGWKWLAPLSICTVLAWQALQPVSAVAAGQCDRACLRLILDHYLQAVFKHDPKAAPLAAQARATQNATPLADGSGIWLTATGYGGVQRRYFDTAAGQAAYYGIINEGSDADIVSLRVKVVRQRVTEAEWTVARKSAGGLFSIEGLLEQPPPPDVPIAAGDRVSRAQLIAAADAYFNGLQTHDGSAVPHIPGCDRIENGIKVTNRLRSTPLAPVPGGAAPASAAGVPALAQETPAAGPAGAAPGMAQEARSGDCTAGFDMFAHSIAEASHRRYPLVDEEAGVVMGATLFHRPPESSLRRNLLTEYFWEKQGRIAAIYAAMFYLDPAAPDSSGWN
jgi:hypothetical protein